MRNFYPRILADKLCPFCFQAKRTGVLVCTRCFERETLNDTPSQRAALRYREDFLQAAEWEEGGV
jgi:hypothetical protein